MEPMTWERLAGIIERMPPGAKYRQVLVKLPDGRLLDAAAVSSREGAWFVVAEEAVEKVVEEDEDDEEDNALNWSYVAGATGDMSNDEEYQKVIVELPDGKTVRVVDMRKVDGQWRLIAEAGG
jgi:hypothetical protein